MTEKNVKRGFIALNPTGGGGMDSTPTSFFSCKKIVARGRFENDPPLPQGGSRQKKSKNLRNNILGRVTKNGDDYDSYISIPDAQGCANHFILHDLTSMDGV